MDWLKKMNEALDYIEDNLTEEIDFVTVAQKACCSTYNFQRMFSFITDITLAEYIRRRKLTNAAFELQNSHIKIIDLALNYGYDSPTSFTRAFKVMHGITPTQARKEGITLKAYPRLLFQITIKGVSEMNYRIETKPAFQVYGVEGIFENENAFSTIPKFWQEFCKNGDWKKMNESLGKDLNKLDEGSIHAVCGYKKISETSFPYMICAFKTPTSKTDGYTIVDVPESTWAIFTSEKHGKDTMTEVTQKLNRRIYTEWFPNSKFDMIEGFDFELYKSDGEKCYEEIWFRVNPNMEKK
ncbi:AraC family transcriptional regulator [Clostridium gelidum]|uniref:AraC family transcriptional regulator n=1 Tax=Clostridium gelidum TaxID=704125 RepID=A0ABN6J1V0_9CLOT|nr:AraC family transcriptional regulator [Clostridium gelidum]BCZ47728.1 AraC family transcriptional regulator [Clostridium gelidum]